MTDLRRRVRVLFDYDAQDSIELTIKEGDEILVIKEDPSGWWKGELNGKVGLFPNNFIEEIADSEPKVPAEESTQAIPPEEQAVENVDHAPVDNGEQQSESAEEDKPRKIGGIAMPGLDPSVLQNRLANRNKGLSIDEQMKQRKAEQAAHSESADFRSGLRTSAAKAAPLATAKGPSAPGPATPIKPHSAPARPGGPPPGTRPPEAAKIAVKPRVEGMKSPPPARVEEGTKPAPLARPQKPIKPPTGPKPGETVAKSVEGEAPTDESADSAPITVQSPISKPALGPKPIGRPPGPRPQAKTGDANGESKPPPVAEKPALLRKPSLQGQIQPVIPKVLPGAAPKLPVKKATTDSDTSNEKEQVTEESDKESFKKDLKNKLSSPASASEIGPSTELKISQAEGELAPYKPKISSKPRCKALYDYDAAAEGELSFKENDIISIRLKDDSGWWQGELNEVIGWFPANFVNEIESEPVEEPSVDDKLAELAAQPRNLLVTIKKTGPPGRRNPTKKNRSDAVTSPKVEKSEKKVESIETSEGEEKVSPALEPVKPSAKTADKKPLISESIKVPPKVSIPKPSEVRKVSSAPKPGDVKPALEAKAFSETKVAGPVKKASSAAAGTLWPTELPTWDEFCTQLTTIFEETKQQKSGKIGFSIPKIDPDAFTVSVCTVDGNHFSCGDSEAVFSLQSCSWLFSYIFTCEEHGEEKIHSLVGSDPLPGPLLSNFWNNDKKPHNPFVSTGAIAIASLLASKLDAATRIANILEKLSNVVGGHVSCSFPAYLSALENSDQEYAVAYQLKAQGVLGKDVDIQKLVQFNWQLASIEVNSSTAAFLAATVANAGKSPTTGEKTMDAKHAKKAEFLLNTCGHGEFSSYWMDTIGLASKSSSSGVVLLVIPNVMGICIYSPRLDPSKPISARAIQFCSQLVKQFPSLRNFKF